MKDGYTSHEHCPVWSIDNAPKLSKSLEEEGDKLMETVNNIAREDIKREQKRMCKELQNLTGVGIFTCREVLNRDDVGWNVKKGLEFLRTNGPDWQRKGLPK
jgi:hypothetical protein